MNVLTNKPVSFRVPAVTAGTLSYLDSNTLRGQRLALAFLPTLRLPDVLLLEQHRASIREAGTILLGVAPLGCPFPPLSSALSTDIQTPILSDPLGRLYRFLGVDPIHRYGRCRTFLIDEHSRVLFQLVHDLNDRGLSALREILRAYRKPAATTGQNAELLSAEIRFAIAPS